MEPEYTAKKSAWLGVTPFRIIFFWLLVPLIMMICDIVKYKHEKIEFYEDKIVQTSGVLSRHVKQSTFAGIYSVSIDQSALGRLFGYGDIQVDVVGKWDVNTTGIKDPMRLKQYLEGKIATRSSIRTVIYD